MKIYGNRFYGNHCINCMEIKGKTPVCSHCNFDEKQYDYVTLHAPPGTTILKKKYLLGKVIGQGGFGVTYLGLHFIINKKVAIKEYLPTVLATREMKDDWKEHEAHRFEIIPINPSTREPFKSGLKAFLNEAKSVARCNHNNIVKIYDFIEENGTAYIVMDYIDGADLSVYLEQNAGILHKEEAKKIIINVLEALKDVHKEGILHLDISPKNICMSKKHDPVLIDFGAAKRMVSINSQSLDAVMKPGYSPFEQYREQGDLGTWSDVYACGATLYKMLTGKTPPLSTDRVARDDVNVNFNVFNADEHLRDVVLKSLAVWYQDRYQTVDEFINGLMEKTGAHKPNTSNNTRKNDKTSLFKKINKPILIIVTLICIVFLVAILGDFITINSGTRPTPTISMSTPDKNPEPTARQTVAITGNNPCLTEEDVINYVNNKWPVVKRSTICAENYREIIVARGRLDVSSCSSDNTRQVVFINQVVRPEQNRENVYYEKKDITLKRKQNAVEIINNHATSKKYVKLSNYEATNYVLNKYNTVKEYIDIEHISPCAPSDIKRVKLFEQINDIDSSNRNKYIKVFYHKDILLGKTIDNINYLDSHEIIVEKVLENRPLKNKLEYFYSNSDLIFEKIDFPPKAEVNKSFYVEISARNKSVSTNRGDITVSFESLNSVYFEDIVINSTNCDVSKYNIGDRLFNNSDYSPYKNADFPLIECNREKRNSPWEKGMRYNLRLYFKPKQTGTITMKIRGTAPVRVGGKRIFVNVPEADIDGVIKDQQNFPANRLVINVE